MADKRIVRRSTVRANGSDRPASTVWNNLRRHQHRGVTGMPMSELHTNSSSSTTSALLPPPPKISVRTALAMPFEPFDLNDDLLNDVTAEDVVRVSSRPLMDFPRDILVREEATRLLRTCAFVRAWGAPGFLSRRAPPRPDKN